MVGLVAWLSLGMRPMLAGVIGEDRVGQRLLGQARSDRGRRPSRINWLWLQVYRRILLAVGNDRQAPHTGGTDGDHEADQGSTA